jgi:hypothetical protein
MKKKAQTKVFPVIGGEDRVRKGKTPAGKPYTSTRTVTGPTKVKGEAGPYEKRFVMKQTKSGGKTRTSGYNRKPEK